ncbi:N-acetyltransferase [Salmonella enterica subsp. enterica serovar Virchow]|nr:N-acetyltransferase [Salmonella enterica subsp. enterica serovar Virchow]
MILLETDRLLIRNWEERDRPLFHLINSDDRVMEFFPFRRSRAQADARMDEIAAGIVADGFGFACAELKATGEPIGFIGLDRIDHLDPHMPAGSIEIGWRLAPQFWRKGYASEGASAWLDFGFERLALDEIVSIAVWNNEASTTVMRKIGMRRDQSSDFDHPQAPSDQPDLERIVVYRISRTEWQKQRATAAGRPLEG